MQKFRKCEIELERDVQKQLSEWKEFRHNTVLQVEGPRQVGKTHEVRKFACANYNQVIYVNLVSDDYGFEDLMLTDDFLEEYCRNAKLGHYVNDASTVLILDEIQESAEVYNHIRDFRERFACDIIVSGSYLARTVKSKDFFLPAGIAYLRIYPLSFQEFCRAAGAEDMLMGLSLAGDSTDEEYRHLEALYQVYRHIGGYPEVVTTYIRTGKEAQCLQTLENLINTFTSESSRFFSNSTALSIFKESYKAVLVQICEEKKGTGKNFLEFATNFVKDSVKEAVSRNEIRAAAAWLYYSGVIDYCDMYNNGDVTDVVSNRRAYIADCGLAYYISNQVTIPNAVIEGMLTETFAYTELNRLYKASIDKKTVRGDKPCFSTCGDYELDFVVVCKDDKRIGIEVKTSNNRARSLEFYKEKGMIDAGFRAALSRGGEGERFDTIPVYSVGCRFPYGH
ncbi:MAG: AAA family ATPase [Lachnospiraceae bacterium]|nr:AAA family ATPase [Lachnospiraceae bacterium]